MIEITLQFDSYALCPLCLKTIGIYFALTHGLQAHVTLVQQDDVSEVYMCHLY